MFFYLLIFVALVIFGCHTYIHNTKEAKLINIFPGPKLFPIIGNGADFIQGACVTFYKGRYMANKFKKNYRLWLINKPSINFIEPDDIEILLSSSKHISKSLLYDFLKPWFNDGLLTSSGEKWQTRRKILTPTFHFNILKQFSTIFIEQGKDLVDKLKIEIGQQETNIQPYLARAALNSICETAMGTNLNDMKDKASTYIDAIYKFGEYLVYRTLNIWLYPPFIFNLSTTARKQCGVIAIMQSFTKKIIEERRRDSIVNVSNGDNKTSKKRLAMLDLLLSAEADGQIDEDGIREEVDTFMFEGHDTTAIATTFCLMLLANNPDIQESVYSEVNDILENSNDPASIDDLNNMKHLERCIKETMRLYPSVPFISRILKEDLHLKNFIIPAKTICNVHIFDLHRSDTYFPNPDKFDPDRFLPENTRNRHPFAYIPFSAGPRNCIGQKFAILESKAIVSSILQKYRLEPITKPEDVIFAVDLVLRTVNSIKVKLIPRTKFV